MRPSPLLLRSTRRHSQSAPELPTYSSDFLDGDTTLRLDGSAPPSPSALLPPIEETSQENLQLSHQLCGQRGITGAASSGALVLTGLADGSLSPSGSGLHLTSPIQHQASPPTSGSGDDVIEVRSSPLAAFGNTAGSSPSGGSAVAAWDMSGVSSTNPPIPTAIGITITTAADVDGKASPRRAFEHSSGSGGSSGSSSPMTTTGGNGISRQVDAAGAASSPSCCTSSDHCSRPDDGSKATSTGGLGSTNRTLVEAERTRPIRANSEPMLEVCRTHEVAPKHEHPCSLVRQTSSSMKANRGGPVAMASRSDFFERSDFLGSHLDENDIVECHGCTRTTPSVATTSNSAAVYLEADRGVDPEIMWRPIWMPFNDKMAYNVLQHNCNHFSESMLVTLLLLESISRLDRASAVTTARGPEASEDANVKMTEVLTETPERTSDVENFLDVEEQEVRNLLYRTLLVQMIFSNFSPDQVTFRLARHLRGALPFLDSKVSPVVPEMALRNPRNCGLYFVRTLLKDLFRRLRNSVRSFQHRVVEEEQIRRNNASSSSSTRHFGDSNEYETSSCGPALSRGDCENTSTSSGLSSNMDEGLRRRRQDQAVAVREQNEVAEEAQRPPCGPRTASSTGWVGGKPITTFPVTTSFYLEKASTSTCSASPVKGQQPSSMLKSGDVHQQDLLDLVNEVAEKLLGSVASFI
ncbi:unnamed protein product [Amoebophrya sp. A25]|nr:unnamed protein product [Amoebophrya sp. A25]|eukprot:GSA25T00024362001.1